MKTLLDVKKNYAQECGYNSWVEIARTSAYRHHLKNALNRFADLNQEGEKP